MDNLIRRFFDPGTIWSSDEELDWFCEDILICKNNYGKTMNTFSSSLELVTNKSNFTQGDFIGIFLIGGKKICESIYHIYGYKETFWSRYFSSKVEGRQYLKIVFRIRQPTFWCTMWCMSKILHIMIKMCNHRHWISTRFVIYMVKI